MSKTLTTEGFKSIISEIHGDKYTILSEYTGTHKPILVRHNICGNEYEIKRAGNLKKSKRCNFCRKIEGGKHSDITFTEPLERFKHKVNELTNGEYIVLSDVYINNKTKIKFRHNLCGHEYETRPDQFIRGRRCPKCANEKRGINLRKYTGYVSADSYLTDMVTDEPYTWLEDYKGNNKIKHKIKHEICGHEYEVRPNDFQQGYRCPNCSNSQNSNAMNRIKEILTKNNIEFELEKTFKEFDKRKRFDIIFKNYVLEYDGEQHFLARKNSMIVDADKLKVNKTRDHIKNSFMISQEDYIFIRLHYRLKTRDIDHIIKSILNDELTYEIITNYNLYYYNPYEDVLLNPRTYYTSINKDYFNDLH